MRVWTRSTVREKKRRKRSEVVEEEEAEKAEDLFQVPSLHHHRAALWDPQHDADGLPPSLPSFPHPACFVSMEMEIIWKLRYNSYTLQFSLRTLSYVPISIELLFSAALPFPLFNTTSQSVNKWKHKCESCPLISHKHHLWSKLYP